jgi:hypothetical protein
LDGKGSEEITMQEVIELLRTPVDKYLFIMFRDRSITVDQLKSRLAERHSGTTYFVLDDLKDTLDPSLMERS